MFFLIRVIVSAAYFFGGVHKINPVYYDTIYLWMMKPYLEWVDKGFLNTAILKLGYLTPYLEIIMGVGLWFRPAMKIASVMAIVMHIVIMISLGPWGNNFNYIIFPWNVALILTNLMLIVKPDYLKLNWAIIKNPVITAVIAVNWLVPVTCYWKISDSYISHDLYSGKAWFGFVILPAKALENLPFNIRKRFVPYDNNRFYVNLTEWSLNELGVPLYPEKRVLIYYKKYFETFVEDPSTVELIAYSQKKYENIR